MSDEKIDFIIDEGGMYPESAFHYCGCVPDADPPRFPDPRGECRCGFRCPTCGVAERWTRDIELIDEVAGRSVKTITCNTCGARLFRYEVKHLRRITPAKEAL